MSCIFSACFGCCDKKPLATKGPPRSTAALHVPPAPSSLPSIIPSIQQPRQEYARPPPRPPAYQLITSVPKNEIKSSDQTPEPDLRKEFRYSCPLCFRYFDRIFSRTSLRF